MLTGQHELPLHQLHCGLYDRRLVLPKVTLEGVRHSSRAGNRDARPTRCTVFVWKSPMRMQLHYPDIGDWDKHYLCEHLRWSRGNRWTHLGKSNHGVCFDRAGKHVLHDPG